MSPVALSRDLSPSQAVVQQIAALEGVEPTDLRTPLYDSLDPEALDDLVASALGRGLDPRLTVVFTFAGYEVRVAGDGSVSVST